MDQNRLIQYLSTHLSPINFISEYQNKTLPVSILFYKMCNSFPKEKLGGIKGAFKHIQEAKLQPWKAVLSDTEFQTVLKNQNNNRPKIGQYVEFLVLSILETCAETGGVKFSSLQEDISEGWDFKVGNQKYDITTNLNKIARPGIILIPLPLWELVDSDNLILPNGVNFIIKQLQQQKMPLNSQKLDYTKTILQKVRSKYIEISRHQVKPMDPVVSVAVHKSEPTQIVLPPLGSEELSVQTNGTKLENVSIDDMTLIGDIQALSPSNRQKIELLLKALKN